MVTVAEVDAFVDQAHAGQVDKIGVPYVEHVRAVAAGLAPFGPDLEMAGLLHDVLEDTDCTPGRLRAMGVPNRVVDIVETVTNRPGISYADKIRHITGNRGATLVKIADNAHNSRPDRAARLSDGNRARLAAKYRSAREFLWPAVTREEVEEIVSIVNPALLEEL
ncbi:phosphohydrolase [Streptomyces sp. MS06]|uniref:phosphohydrolase n=1 Tax=Streptomyces sp. MS06 TaxID=3385974 RepID=UPI0039A354C7